MTHLSEEHQSELRSVVPTVRIILFALANGALVFGVIVYWLKRDADPDPGLVSYLAAATAFLAIPLAVVLPQALAKSAGGISLPGSLGHRFLTTKVVSGAVLEGSAFFNLTVYLIEASPLNLIVAAAILVLIVRLIPTYESAVRWAEGKTI